MYAIAVENMSTGSSNDVTLAKATAALQAARRIVYLTSSKITNPGNLFVNRFVLHNARKGATELVLLPDKV